MPEINLGNVNNQQEEINLGNVNEQQEEIELNNLRVTNEVSTLDGVRIIEEKTEECVERLEDILDDVDGELAKKADKATTYTKTEVDELVTPKADKTYVDNQLALKADKETTYTKTEVDTSLALKADKETTYTKTEVDTSLDLKADKATTYTKTEVDSLVQSVFRYKGTKATVAEVEALTQKAVGDMWFVTADGSEYAWNGTVWEKLGPIIDLTPYLLNISIAGLTINAQSTTITNDQLLTALGVYTKTEVDTMKEAVDEHLETVDSAISTDTETVTGNPVTVETQSARIAEKTVINLEPKQDLHGYDHPWPAGGGKNKYDMNSDHYGENKIWDTKTGKLLSYDGYYASPKIPIKSETQYTRTIGTSGNIFYDANGNHLITTYTGGTFTSPENAEFVAFNVSNEINHNTVQLEEGSSLSAYSPYSNICPIDGFDGVEVKRTGKNLLKVVETAQTIRGVTFTVNEDGTILANGTASDRIRFYFNPTFTVPAGSYILSGCPSGGGDGTYNLLVSANNIYFRDIGNGITINASTNITNPAIIISGGTTCDNLLFKPMLRLATETDPTFEPYQSQSISITFPTEAGTVYGGTLTIEKDGSGTLVVDSANIASYAGETLPGAWISDRDVYSAGATPTTGAQVVYELATPLTYSLSAKQVSLLKGINHVSTDGTSLELTARKGVFATLDDIADEYEWTNNKLEEMSQQIGDMIADSDQIIATKNHAVGDVFICENKLYKATDSIASGEMLIEGSNVTKTTIIAVIAEQIQAAMN